MESVRSLPHSQRSVFGLISGSPMHYRWTESWRSHALPLDCILPVPLHWSVTAFCYAHSLVLERIVPDPSSRVNGLHPVCSTTYHYNSLFQLHPLLLDRTLPVASCLNFIPLCLTSILVTLSTHRFSEYLSGGSENNFVYLFLFVYNSCFFSFPKH